MVPSVGLLEPGAILGEQLLGARIVADLAQDVGDHRVERRRALRRDLSQPGLGGLEQRERLLRLALCALDLVEHARPRREPAALLVERDHLLERLLGAREVTALAMDDAELA